MSRCWGCCQENCGYYRCSCDCHNDVFGRNSTFDVVKYEALEEANKRAEKIVLDAVEVLAKRYPCDVHHRYQAKRKPRSQCEACWRYYIKVNPNVESK